MQVNEIEKQWHHIILSDVTKTSVLASVALKYARKELKKKRLAF